MEQFEVTVYYLEMKSASHRFVPATKEDLTVALPFLNVIPAECGLDAAGEGMEFGYRAADAAGMIIHVQHEALPQAVGIFQPIAAARDHTRLGVQALHRSARLASVKVGQNALLPAVEECEELEQLGLFGQQFAYLLQPSRASWRFFAVSKISVTSSRK